VEGPRTFACLLTVFRTESQSLEAAAVEIPTARLLLRMVELQDTQVAAQGELATVIQAVEGRRPALVDQRETVAALPAVLAH
jgi:hypothetical protein